MTLFPQLSRRGVEVIDRRQVSSTNVLVKAMLADGELKQPVLMLADEQTAGHGKFDRHFYSAPNCGAYFSIGLPLASLPANWTPQHLTATAAVAVYQVASRFFHCDLTIKWVNDLYRGNRKVTGILAETALDHSNQLQGLVIGCGIDLTTDPHLPAAIRAKVGALTDEPVSGTQRRTFVDQVGAHFLDLLAAPWDQVLAVYRDHQYLQDKELTVWIGEQEVSGSFAQITDDGYLQIKTATGLRTFSAGTVRLQQ